MTKNESVFTSFWFTLAMSVLAIAMLVNYTMLVVEGLTALRIFGLVAWIGMVIYFIRTFLTRLRERQVK